MKFAYYPHLIKFFSAAAVWSLINFIPIFAKSIGLTDTDIGIAASLYGGAMLLSTYAFGRLADAVGRRKLIVAGLLLSCISFAMYVYAKDFPSFLLVRLFTGVSISVFASAIVAYAHDAGFKLGRLSAFDPLGAAFGSILLGTVALYSDIIALFLIGAVFFAGAFITSLRLKDGRFIKIHAPLLPYGILKRNSAVYISFFIRHTAANSIWVFWGLYLLQLGGNLFWIGVAMAINTITQFLIMFTLTDKIKVKTLIPLGTLLSSLTFFAFALSANIWQILAAQIILGASWAFLYVGSVRWIADNTKEKATGIGLLHAIINLSAFAGPVLSTAVIQFGGYRTVMYAAAFIAFFSFVVFDLVSKGNKHLKEGG